eukprot:Trichotokara_eunicae@DN5837_c0_g1_i2.p1
MGFDSDQFSQWEAGQILFTNLVLAQARKRLEGSATGDEVVLSKMMVDALRNLLTKKDDLHLQSSALILPGVGELAPKLQPVSCPVALTDARRDVKKAITKALKKELKEVYGELKKSLHGVEYKITPEDVGKRQMRNLCMSYLAVERNQESATLAYEHFKNAEQMTDKISGYRELVDFVGFEERDKAITEFYEYADGDDLIIDKWFAVQAAADIPNVIDEVKKLYKHKDFNMKTPSRMRALVYYFAGANKKHFHAVDESGYEFVVDRIIELDAFNRSVAARLATYLVNHKDFDEARQTRVKKFLQKILDSKPTPDTFEVVTKGLQ